MTEKKITRRGFVQGLAACLVSVPFVPGLVKLKEPEINTGDNTSVHVVEWKSEGPITATEVVRRREIHKKRINAAMRMIIDES